MIKLINKWFYGEEADKHSTKESIFYLLCAPVVVAGLLVGCMLIGIL